MLDGVYGILEAWLPPLIRAKKNSAKEKDWWICMRPVVLAFIICRVSLEKNAGFYSQGKRERGLWTRHHLILGKMWISLKQLYGWIWGESNSGSLQLQWAGSSALLKCQVPMGRRPGPGNYSHWTNYYSYSSRFEIYLTFQGPATF